MSLQPSFWHSCGDLRGFRQKGVAGDQELAVWCGSKKRRQAGPRKCLGLRKSQNEGPTPALVKSEFSANRRPSWESQEVYKPRIVRFTCRWQLAAAQLLAWVLQSSGDLEAVLKQAPGSKRCQRKHGIKSRDWQAVIDQCSERKKVRPNSKLQVLGVAGEQRGRRQTRYTPW